MSPYPVAVSRRTMDNTISKQLDSTADLISHAAHIPVPDGPHVCVVESHHANLSKSLRPKGFEWSNSYAYVTGKPIIGKLFFCI